jgi:mannose-6-phosphate isomerase-like protein (cupin superfamily)
MVKILTKNELKSIGFYVLNSIEKWVALKHSVAEYSYEEYHNFSKALVPFYKYEDFLYKAFKCSTEDVLIEVARVKGDHAKDLHYHKKSHAFCIVLGESSGVPDCEDGYIEINNIKYISKVNDYYYFPSYSHHTFHGGSKQDLYFLSIQNPPLVTKSNDDFYFVNA